MCFIIEGMVALAQETGEAFPLALADVIPPQGVICDNALDTLSVMQEIGPRLAQAGLGHVAPFNDVYTEVTGIVAERIGREPGTEGAFQDREVVDYMVGKFADYYFKQLRGYLSLSDEQVDPAWQFLLYRGNAEHAVPEIAPYAQRVQSEEMLTGAQFLLGMNAHINYDLGQALCDPKVTSAYYEDYTWMIGLLIDLTAKRLAKTYVPGPEWSRKMLTMFTVATIASWREQAWRAGEELAAAGEDKIAVAGIIRHLNRNSVKTGRRIATMGNAALRGFARLPARQQFMAAE